MRKFQQRPHNPLAGFLWADSTPQFKPGMFEGLTADQVQAQVGTASDNERRGFKEALNGKPAKKATNIVPLSDFCPCGGGVLMEHAEDCPEHGDAA